jgi:hypothetical protein
MGHRRHARLLVGRVALDDDRAVGEVRPLLAERGCTVEDGIRLRSLADVVVRLGASGQVGPLNATEVRMRAPRPARPDGSGSSPGGPRQHRQALVLTDAAGGIRR